MKIELDKKQQKAYKKFLAANILMTYEYYVSGLLSGYYVDFPGRENPSIKNEEDTNEVEKYKTFTKTTSTGAYGLVNGICFRTKKGKEKYMHEVEVFEKIGKDKIKITSINAKMSFKPYLFKYGVDTDKPRVKIDSIDVTTISKDNNPKEYQDIIDFVGTVYEKREESVKISIEQFEKNKNQESEQEKKLRAEYFGGGRYGL